MHRAVCQDLCAREGFPRPGLQGRVHSGGRFPSARLRQGLHYSMHVAGATTAGGLGVEIWVAHSVAKSVSDVSSLSPRCMSLCLALPSCPITAICAHAPHEMAKHADMDLFWKMIEDHFHNLQARRPSDITLLGIDGNAQSCLRASAP